MADEINNCIDDCIICLDKNCELTFSICCNKTICINCFPRLSEVCPYCRYAPLICLTSYEELRKMYTMYMNNEIDASDIQMKKNQYENLLSLFKLMEVQLFLKINNIKLFRLYITIYPYWINVIQDKNKLDTIITVICKSNLTIYLDYFFTDNYKLNKQIFVSFFRIAYSLDINCFNVLSYIIRKFSQLYNTNNTFYKLIRKISKYVDYTLFNEIKLYVDKKHANILLLEILSQK